MEYVMVSLVHGDCVSSSESLKNLGDVASSVCEALTSRRTSLLNDKDLQASPDDRDGLLLQINLLISLFQAKHCKKVQELRQGIIGNTKLFESIVQFLGDHHHLISYSACKVLVPFLIGDAARLSKFKYLVQSCLEAPLYLSTNDDKSCYRRMLLTFDLFRLLCKKPRQKENKLHCSCGDIQRSIWVDREVDMLEAISGFFLLLEPFEILLKEKKDSHCADDVLNEERRILHDVDDVDVENTELISEKLKWLRCFQSTELDMLCLSYLKMVKSCIKGNCKDISEPILIKIVNFLVRCLKEGFWYTRQSLRISFDILAIILQSRSTNDDMAEHEGFWEFGKQTARSLCELIDAEWLSRLPCGTATVGFGGVNFTEICPDQMRDLTLLRRLTKLIFISVQLITESDQGENVFHLTCSASGLGHLKTFTESLKLDVSSEIRTDWIHQLFADEDELMVSVLLIALQIYNQIIRTYFNKHSDVTTIPARCELKRLLCPHVLFWNYLKLLDFDHSVLLDLLMSSETNFLEYFTSYLHLMRHEWDKCCDIFRMNSKENEILAHMSEVDDEDLENPPKRLRMMKNISSDVEATLEGDHSSSNLAGNRSGSNDMSLGYQGGLLTLGREIIGDKNSLNKANYEKAEINNPVMDQILSVLIRLRMSLERLQKRNMFPYSISPLLRSLHELESLYER